MSLFEKRRFLIWGKTTPELSLKYFETVYRDPVVFALIVQKGKSLFVEQRFIDTKDLKVDASLHSEDPRQEITIGTILAYLGKDRSFN
jgi:hypothetical protein